MVSISCALQVEPSQIIDLMQAKGPPTATPLAEQSSNSPPTKPPPAAAPKKLPPAVAAAAAKASRPSPAAASSATASTDNSFKYKFTPEDAEALWTDLI